MDMPIIGFPAHWAPNDIEFYTGDQFPSRYRGGAFIAFGTGCTFIAFIGDFMGIAFMAIDFMAVDFMGMVFMAGLRIEFARRRGA